MVAPLLTVLMDDGAVHEIQATNADLVAEELDRFKKHRPGPNEAQITWMTWIAWHGLRREGIIAGELTFDAFVRLCVSIGPTELVETDPSPPVPETG